MRRPFLFFAIVFLWGASIPRRSRFKDVTAEICAIVRKDFYKQTPALDRFNARCPKLVPAFAKPYNLPTYLDQIQAELDELGVSHMRLYDPHETAQLRPGIGRHTGVYSRYVDGHLVIYRVVKDSAAGRLGLRAGDEIVTLPNIEEVSPEGAMKRRGTWHLVRGGRPFTVEMSFGPVYEHGGPEISAGPNGTKVLTIPSFEMAYMSRELIREIAEKLRGAPRVIVDLRENGGGDIGGALRPLAIFLGPGVEIGSLRKDRVGGPVITLAENFDRPGQQEIFHRAGEIKLRTPPGYEHYEGPVTVLIAERTASASEIFADAMTRRPMARVWGWPTAGRVLMAGYHDMPKLGFDYMFSLPIAAYYNVLGEELESRGVRASRTLHFDLEQELRGEDSWINEAAR